MNRLLSHDTCQHVARDQSKLLETAHQPRKVNDSLRCQRRHMLNDDCMTENLRRLITVLDLYYFDMRYEKLRAFDKTQ